MGKNFQILILQNLGKKKTLALWLIVGLKFMKTLWNKKWGFPCRNHIGLDMPLRVTTRLPPPPHMALAFPIYPT
jgi:hypothetical protein